MKNKKLLVALGATTLLALASCGPKAISKDDFVKRYETALTERGNLAINSVSISGKATIEMDGKSETDTFDPETVKVDKDGSLYSVTDPSGSLGTIAVAFGSSAAVSLYFTALETTLTVAYYDFMVTASGSATKSGVTGTFKEEMTFNSKGLLTKDYYRIEGKSDSKTAAFTLELTFADYK